MLLALGPISICLFIGEFSETVFCVFQVCPNAVVSFLTVKRSAVTGDVVVVVSAVVGCAVVGCAVGGGAGVMDGDVVDGAVVVDGASFVGVALGDFSHSAGIRGTSKPNSKSEVKMDFCSRLVWRSCFGCALLSALGN